MKNVDWILYEDMELVNCIAQIYSECGSQCFPKLVCCQIKNPIQISIYYLFYVSNGTNQSWIVCSLWKGPDDWIIFACFKSASSFHFYQIVCTFYLSSVWKNLFGLAWCNFIQKWPWSLWSYCEIVFPPDGSHSCIYVNLVVILFMINSYCKFVLFDCKYFILLVKWKLNWNIHLWVIMCRWSR